MTHASSLPSDALHSRVKLLMSSSALPLLAGLSRGIEKEGLRVTPQGKLSLTAHPTELGAALTHGQITTDYSESQLELVTPVAVHPWESLEQLDRLHRFTLGVMGEELMWPASMPCTLPPEPEIPIAQYGTSREGRKRMIYRRGLGHRYGRAMQMISGVHYNFSMPKSFWQYAEALWPELPADEELSDYAYFGLMRNVQRYSWLLAYLFGASPMMERSCFNEASKLLLVLDELTLGLPWATSLRVSDLGYASHQPSPSLAGLEAYLEDLSSAMETPHPEFLRFGSLDSEEPQQLNGNRIQSESEIYSDVRPKCRLAEGESLLQALTTRGVEYVELRTLDLNPFLPHGLDEGQIHFLDAFMLYCLLADSPPLTIAEQEEAQFNKRCVALEGRSPGAMLRRRGRLCPLERAATELLDGIETVARLLDLAQYRERGSDWLGRIQAHHQSVLTQRAKVEDSRLTPSARIMEGVAAAGSFRSFALAQAQRHKAFFLSAPLSSFDSALMQNQAADSLRRQQLQELQEKKSQEV
ncbi:glutamate--cysteine ligase [Ferrimonas sp.]|uniref:glutamate--cysteine ligase n=1 Tax=Ferrimonas sp. TaxID=2080861 RepID=UPI003A8CC172